MAETLSQGPWKRLLVATAAAGLVVPVLGVLPAYAAAAAKPYDFDGDGFAELVVGVPSLDVGSHREAGGVVVLESEGGPFAQTTITQSSSKVAGASEKGDRFGAAVVSADFDRDGYADLAVGLPGEDLDKAKNAGAVTVLYGSRTGLTGTRSKQVAEPSGRRTDAHFGEVLAAGDVSGDGYPDLLVSAPDEDVDVDSADQAGGTVTVLLGSSRGLQSKGSTQVHGIRKANGDPGFGSRLAVADVDGDGRSDFIVGSATRLDLTDDETAPGSVTYCAGKTGGPTSCRRLAYGDEFGGIRALAVGNVAGDARPEILVGVPLLDVPVQVLSLTGTGGATTVKANGFEPSRPGASGYDGFGSSLATADLDGDGYDDLVVGAPGTNIDGEDFAGRVHIVPGARGGLQSGRLLSYDENTPNVPGGAEEEDRFGQTTTLVDVTHDGQPDLTVGAPGEDNSLGSVTTLPGSRGGPTTQGSLKFNPKDIPDDGQSSLAFGAVLGR